MNRKSFCFLLSLIVTILATRSMLSVVTTKAQTELANSVDSSSNPLLQQYDIGNSSLNKSNTNGNILIRGIISSEPGQPEQLNVQRTIILPHRQDGNDYTGILTYSASRPVEVLLGHRLGVDNKTLLSIDTKKFGNLFLVNPIHPNAGYVLSVPTVIKPNYADFSPPYYSASIPFVASSVVLRTLGGLSFVAVYEAAAHLGHPLVLNNLTTAETNITNITK
ncbi:MAG TPA: hypothetical protein VFI73_01555 [Candidatus Nitrosopolaris sp.]|nr:hypothetical protein [Candidatus Nitrosopolaris sp.]